MEQKCANCGNGKWRDGVTPITETCCQCKYVDKGALVPQPSNWIPKEQTNADRIRAMTDEELAWELMTWRIETEAKHKGVESSYPNTQATILEWLQQPA